VNTAWRVVILDDHVNSYAVVVYLLQMLCGMTLEHAVRFANDVHHRGSADVAVFPAQEEAERLVVAFQRRGLHATARRG
jgi:ATP-dependent Clp protease adapter protein ClpS